MTIDFSSATWINPPKKFEITPDSVRITTDPHTDFWQRSYYGFRNDNAPALLLESTQNFTLTVRATFQYRGLFDQCGVIIYLDSENWFKASIEFENERFARLGSVVTNRGYSDWATTDISTPGCMWYRLSRRGPDFLIEASPTGSNFAQMRVFHLQTLGDTAPEMGKLNPPAPAEKPVRFGLYACSPIASSFEVVFDNLQLEDCLWKAHASD
jgi:regulation of enolase protein 1 (concanavalin A-like superfamily)